ncbi:Ltp family lipoprotein [Paenibacillus cymbidii]|uniref:Ltp family lipoprotein n=1 Tax=Paenibacillus cymbidii TaxID=1639034 RepID=UPI0010818DF3|nr:Ltp family lipoprotein [Paenibacillus cymbidii]
MIITVLTAILSGCGSTNYTGSSVVRAVSSKTPAVNGNDADKAATSTNTSEPAVTPAKDGTKEKKEEPPKEDKKAEDNVPKEYKSALKKAESYAKTMNMSKMSINDQLTSEYGVKFSQEAATYAINNLEFDWKANALKKAESYSKSMYMSKQGIYDQLVSEHGEKFTKEEADYAIENLDK